MNKTTAPQRWWDLPSVLTLFVAILMATMRLTATKWTEELSIIHLIAILGLATGLGLGMSIFTRKSSLFFAMSYGVFTLGWQLGTTLGSGIQWGERLVSILERIEISTSNLFQQKAVTDPILFITLMGLLFWILSVHAGYTLTRHGNPWQTILPTGLALFVIHVNDPYWPNRAWFLAGYIFLSLLLLSRLTFLKKQYVWKENHTHLPPYVGLDFLRVTLIAGAVIIILAWTAPALAASISPIRDAWSQVARPYYEAKDRISNAFASLRSSVGLVRDYYGETLPLGRGNTLTDNVVLTIAAPDRPSAGIRFYWRARVYDIFQDRQWRVTNVETEKMNANNFELAQPVYDTGRWEASFTVVPGVAMATIYAAPQPTWISRPVQVEFTTNQDGTIDLWALQASPSLQPGDSYEFSSSLSNVTIQDMRNAGTDYPEWVTARYLQLPDNITSRTLDLAQRIAEGLDNPYDITNAVTEYLRENIEYSETIPSPPANQEVIDWILFDLKQGFCNYYATAEILLLRSLGIPARLAVGYSQGNHDTETNTYTVRQRDAHAWPEVYYPKIGWVEFEPTLNQRPLLRPLGEDINSNRPAGNPNRPDIFPDESPGDRFPLEENLNQDFGSQGGFFSPNNISWYIIAFAGLIFIGFAGYLWYRSQFDPAFLKQVQKITSISTKLEKSFIKIGINPPEFLRNWAYNSSLPLQARAYREINRSLQRLGTEARPNNTPSERASALSVLLPSASVYIQNLLVEYQSLTYRATPGDESTALNAARVIRRTTNLEIIRRLVERFQKLLQPKRKV